MNKIKEILHDALPLAILLGANLLIFFLLNRPVLPLFHTTAYSLSNAAMLCSYYDEPDGKEVMVLHLDDSPQAEKVEVERKPGERWLDKETAKVLEVDGEWAKIDLNDGGEPVYLESEYVEANEVPYFKGRDIVRGVDNMAPMGISFILGLMLYFIALYPLAGIFHTKKGIEGDLMVFEVRIGFVYLAYLGLMLIFKYIFGYDLIADWAMSFNYCNSWYMPILNGIILLVGSLVHVMVFMEISNKPDFLNYKTLPRKVFIGQLGYVFAGVYVILTTFSFVFVIAFIVLFVVLLFNLLPAVFSSLTKGASHAKPSGIYDVHGRELIDMGNNVYRSCDGKEYHRIGPKFECTDCRGKYVDTPGEEEQ